MTFPPNPCWETAPAVRPAPATARQCKVVDGGDLTSHQLERRQYTPEMKLIAAIVENAAREYVQLRKAPPRWSSKWNSVNYRRERMMDWLESEALHYGSLAYCADVLMTTPDWLRAQVRSGSIRSAQGGR